MNPTLYHLIFKTNNCREYDVWEQHTCQETGCLWTEEQYTGSTCLPGKESEFVEEYNAKILNGKVSSYEIEDYLEVE